MTVFKSKTGQFLKFSESFTYEYDDGRTVNVYIFKFLEENTDCKLFVVGLKAYNKLIVETQEIDMDKAS